MTTSSELFERAKELIPGGVNSPVRAFRAVGGTPFFTKRANGATLTTADDRELIDFVCTWGPAIHGHNNETIREAVTKALEGGMAEARDEGGCASRWIGVSHPCVSFEDGVHAGQSRTLPMLRFMPPRAA